MDDMEIRRHFNISACVVADEMAAHYKRLNSGFSTIDKVASGFRKDVNSRMLNAILNNSLITRDGHSMFQVIPKATTVSELAMELSSNPKRYVILYSDLTKWWQLETQQLLSVQPPWVSDEAFDGLISKNQLILKKNGLPVLDSVQKQPQTENEIIRKSKGEPWTKEQIAEVKRQHDEGKTQEKIAECFGVSRQALGKILRGRVRQTEKCNVAINVQPPNATPMNLRTK